MTKGGVAGKIPLPSGAKTEKRGSKRSKHFQKRDNQEHRGPKRKVFKSQQVAPENKANRRGQARLKSVKRQPREKINKSRR